MRQVKAFRESNHEKLAETINQWLRQNNAIAINLTVDYSQSVYFHAFLIYEIR
jgi:hypothetical protein